MRMVRWGFLLLAAGIGAMLVVVAHAVNGCDGWPRLNGPVNLKDVAKLSAVWRRRYERR